MGDEISPAMFSRENRTCYRQKVRRCLDVFALMLDAFRFDTERPMTGLEVELDLIDASGEPAMHNAAILAQLGDPTFQKELGQFNLEFNAHPRMIAEDGFDDYHRELTDRLGQVDVHAHKHGVSVVPIGILPTLTPAHTVLSNMSPEGRYLSLNEQIMVARGEDIALDIRGVERLQITTDSIAPEAAGTSVQCHLQVSPEDFAAYWNASQAIAGAQVAVGANSPFLFGRRLWSETRIALFEQSTDTRPEELKTQGVRPRAWFGERWIASVFDLFEENVRYYPPLLPVCTDEDPVEVLHAGGAPELSELRLHNGTVYRWNRPVYDVMEGRPHLRVENRVMPTGPTVPDMLANVAFYFGLARALAEEDRPVWSQLTFSMAEENFHASSRHGIAAHLYWPRLGEVRATDLVLEWLLPKAYEGLDRYGVDGRLRDQLLGVIEQRCLTGRNGAVWQAATVAAEESRGLDRPAALRAMLLRYVAHQRTGEPVHTWELPTLRG